MSHQRRRKGIPALAWRSKRTTDRKGNQQYHPTDVDKIPLKVWVMPQRSSRAEVPGQQQIDVTRIGFWLPAEEMGDINLWSRLEMGGNEWDFASPPVYHHGTARHSRHYSADVRKRP